VNAAIQERRRAALTGLGQNRQTGSPEPVAFLRTEPSFVTQLMFAQ